MSTSKIFFFLLKQEHILSKVKVQYEKRESFVCMGSIGFPIRFAFC